MNISETLRKIQDYVRVGENSKPKSLPSLPAVVEEARQEWLNAQYYYNTVSDQDLIDHAVYLMQATEKKYMYLLKQARSAGIVYSPYMTSDDAEIGENEVITR
ncbi:MAG: hypothetical protein H6Q68_3231 [Firmicutes bacterium]|nr:hypothetical protein [Bacillota bacterium]